jgi:hypothetical protein
MNNIDLVKALHHVWNSNSGADQLTAWRDKIKVEVVAWHCYDGPLPIDRQDDPRRRRHRRDVADIAPRHQSWRLYSLLSRAFIRRRIS